MFSVAPVTPRLVARHIDSALSGKLCKCCDSTVAVAGTCRITGVTFATISAAFFQLDAFIVINVPLYKYKITNTQ